MEPPASNLEGWRGVDIGQIRRQLGLPVPDRVRVMVESANLLIEIRAHARAARNAKAG